MPKVLITGHRGMVGSALVRAVQKNYADWSFLLADRNQLDLLDQSKWKIFIITKDQIYYQCSS